MALPVSPGPRTPDVAVTGWAALTVRIAWVLLCEGVKLKPGVLRDARDHALYHLDPSLPLPHAEDRVDRLTRVFVARARRRKVQDAWPQDAEMPLSPRWRKALERSLTPLTLAVFRQHFGDARPLDHLEQSLQADRVALEGARGGLREVVRQAACADGLPVEEWSNERLDALLRRLAAFAPDPCPPLGEMLDGGHRVHVAGCPRCTRTARLVRSQALSRDELEPPLGRARPPHQVTVLALHLHPDGRHHRDTLAREAGVPFAPGPDDVLLLDFSDPRVVTEVLALATRVGAPARDHVRGLVLSGPGRWSRHGLLGPVPSEAEMAVRSRPWGVVEGAGELPGPMPAPPSARRWWAGVGALAVLAALSVVAAADGGPRATHPLDASFSVGRGGIWSAFDVDGAAYVTLVRQTETGLDVVLHSTSAADKAALATGDGSYRLHTMGRGVLLASTGTPLAALEPMVTAAAGAGSPLKDLAARIRQADPGADVRTTSR